MKTDVLPGLAAGTGPDPASQHEKDLTKLGLSAFCQDMQLRGLAETTQNTTLRTVRRYCVWSLEHGIDPQHPRREDLLAYLAYIRSRELTLSSLQRGFSCLSAWFTYLEEAGLVDKNPVPAIQKRYLHSYKEEVRQRKLISVEDAAKMVRATIDTRDRAVLVLLLKTGIRKNELVTLDLNDINLQEQTLKLKPTAKRSNRDLFLDGETSLALHRWLRQREERSIKRSAEKALFIARDGTRLEGAGVLKIVTRAAVRVGLHDSKSDRLEDHFTPHCCRHWFTTHLRRAGMPREFIQELRGDVRREAIDIYDHVDKEELKESYLACIPKLGV